MLHNSVLSVQLEKCKKKKKKKKKHRGVLPSAKSQAAIVPKATPPTRLPNCTNGTKSRNSSHIHIY